MITPGLLVILGGCALALLIGSGLRWWMLYSGTGQAGTAQLSQQDAQGRLSSLRAWWLLLILFSAALLTGPAGLAVLFCTTSLIGLSEFHAIFARRTPTSKTLLWLLWLLSMTHFAMLMYFEPSGALLATTGLLLVTVNGQQLWAGNVKDYLRTSGGYIWAGLVLVLGLSCAVALTALPISDHRWNAGIVGWTLFVVLLTETNDITQALVGRHLGRHAIIPRVSPGKTWEGLAGGVLVTSLLSVLLSAPLTTLWQERSLLAGASHSLVCGMATCLAGFLGDVNISALKREAGLKDSSQLFPGMGGMLDRLDSLTFSAPALYTYALIWNV